MVICSGLSGSTLITTKEYGVVKIEEVVGEHLHVWDGNDWTVADITYSGKKQLCKVNFGRGVIVECSPTHKFLTVNTNGNKSFIETSHLMDTKTKRRVVINQKYANPEFIYKSDSTDKLTVHTAHTYYLDDIQDSYKVGIFLGRLASDGNISKDESLNCIRLLVAEHEVDVLKVLQDITKCWKVSLWESGIRAGRTQNIYWLKVHSKTLANEIRNLNTRFDIPDVLFQDTEMLRGYLCGIFDGDGCICGKTVSLHYGKNYDYSDFMSKVQLALLVFGIRSTWRRNTCDGSFTLTVSHYDNKLFEEYIGFLSETKRAKLANCEETFRDEHVFGKCDIVQSVEITDEFVDMYDVCNTERGYFVANGFVTHNSAADMSKKALIKLDRDERLKALHAKPIIPIHDEVILSAPFRYAREVEKRFAYDMETAATDKLKLDISTDVTVTFNWYGKELDLDSDLGQFEEEIDETCVKHKE